MPTSGVFSIRRDCHYLDKLQVFEPVFDNEELEEEFNAFFYKHNLTPLFTNEHKHPYGVKVGWADAKSVVNGTGYAKTLIEFSDYLSRANDNKMYEEATFRVLYECRDFNRLIKNIKRYMQYMDTFENRHVFNSWNIVWYSKVF